MARYFDKAKFGERLAALMEDNNDTTYSLGEYLQLSNSTVSRYLSGDISPKTTTIQAIAEKYRVNPAWLAGAEGAEKYIKIGKNNIIIDHKNLLGILLGRPPGSWAASRPASNPIDEQDARNYVSKTDYAGRAVKKDRDPAVGDQSDHPD